MNAHSHPYRTREEVARDQIAMREIVEGQSRAPDYLQQRISVLSMKALGMSVDQIAAALGKSDKWVNAVIDQRGSK